MPTDVPPAGSAPTNSPQTSPTPSGAPAADIPPGLLLCANLFFSSQVTGAARALGLRLDVATTAAAAVERIDAGRCRFVLIDLGLPGVDPAELRRRLPADRSPPWWAFGPHVETARFEAARAAGCVDVWPHGRFSADLPALLRHIAAATSPP